MVLTRKQEEGLKIAVARHRDKKLHDEMCSIEDLRKEEVDLDLN